MNTVFMNGLEMKLHGELPAVGAAAPELDLVGQDLQPIKLADFKGQRIVLNIFPSLDTDVCAASVRKFNVEAASLPNTKVICVSKDLPFAAARFCSVNGIENVMTGSGFRSQFGDRYGVRIEDGPLQD
ncbi:MAG: thiol peroxidase, partial [Muribaculaceae bacterium]|nr:thiol peroxidase [Muribaculaceae bacterium]